MSLPGRERTRFLRFLVAAGLSVPVNLGTRILFSRVMPYEIALVLSHLCGMLTAYALTRLFVFERSGRSAASELTRFAMVNGVSVVQTWIVAVGLVRLVSLTGNRALASTSSPSWSHTSSGSRLRR